MTPNPPLRTKSAWHTPDAQSASQPIPPGTDLPPTPALRVSLPTLPAKRGQIRLTKIFPPGTGENSPKGKPAFLEDNECD
jgi:hypothetical protein